MVCALHSNDLKNVSKNVFNFNVDKHIFEMLKAKSEVFHCLNNWSNWFSEVVDKREFLITSYDPMYI